MNELHLTKKDFRVDWFSGKGGGGQHRNKHPNCCRITHIDSGLVATGQSNKSRVANQREAFNKLARLLVAKYEEDPAKPDVRSDNRIRTYHAVRNEVKDHASGLTQTYKHVVEDANIDDMLYARKETVGGNDGK